MNNKEDGDEKENNKKDVDEDNNAYTNKKIVDLSTTQIDHGHITPIPIAL